MTTTTAYSGRQVALLAPGSANWLRTMSASKISAVIGLSPYESRYSLWHRMAGLTTPEPQTNAQARGHYLEDGVARWWADQHPETRVEHGGCWQSDLDPRFHAAPDRMATGRDGKRAGVEVKTDSVADGWGTPGTDQVPIWHHAQATWQMICAGTDRTYFAVLTPYLTFAEYIVDLDLADAAMLVREATAFLDSLPTGSHPQRPDIDAHDSTYQVVRALNPQIEQRDLPLEAHLADRYIAAVRASTDAATELTHVKSLVLDQMGSARRALLGDTPIARRQNGKGGISLYSCFPKDHP